jgi:HEAT repeat protein
LALGRFEKSYEDSLRKCLKDASLEIRCTAGACLLLLDPNNKEALDAVVACMQDMPLAFLRSVGELRLTHERIVACLVKALDHHDGKVQRAAARAVMQIGLPAKAAIPGLIKLLKSKEAIDNDFVPPLCITFPSRVNLAVEALRTMGPAAAPALPTIVKMLQTSDDEERREILTCLAGMGVAARDAAAPLRKLLNYNDETSNPQNLLGTPTLDIGLEAACTLLSVVPADQEALSFIRKNLRSSDKKRCLLALQACQSVALREKLLLPDIIRCLKEKDFRDAAADTLAEFGPDAREAIPILRDILLAEHSDHTLNNAELRGLVGIGKESIPAIITVVRQGSAVRGPACVFLSQFKDESRQIVPVLIGGLFDVDTRMEAAIALGFLASDAKGATIPLLAVYFFDSFVHGEEAELLLLERWALRQVSG